MKTIQSPSDDRCYGVTTHRSCKIEERKGEKSLPFQPLFRVEWSFFSSREFPVMPRDTLILRFPGLVLGGAKRELTFFECQMPNWLLFSTILLNPYNHHHFSNEDTEALRSYQPKVPQLYNVRPAFLPSSLLLIKPVLWGLAAQSVV